MARVSTVLAAFVLSIAVAGCGSSKEDRAVSGAGIGAAAGTAVGIVTGVGIIEGAAIGAAAGGLTGVLTDEEDVDLGDPVWKGTEDEAAVSDSRVAQVQSDLAALGYEPGPADGIYGPKTRSAITRYQNDHGLEPTGAVSGELADHIRGRKEAKRVSDD